MLIITSLLELHDNAIAVSHQYLNLDDILHSFHISGGLDQRSHLLELSSSCDSVVPAETFRLRLIRARARARADVKTLAVFLRQPYSHSRAFLLPYKPPEDFKT